MLRVTDSYLGKSASLKLPSAAPAVAIQSRGFVWRSSHVYFRVRRDTNPVPSKPSGSWEKSISSKPKETPGDYEIDLITLKKKSNGDAEKSASEAEPNADNTNGSSSFEHFKHWGGWGHKKHHKHHKHHGFRGFGKPPFACDGSSGGSFIKEMANKRHGRTGGFGEIFIDDIKVGRREPQGVQLNEPESTLFTQSKNQFAEPEIVEPEQAKENLSEQGQPKAVESEEPKEKVLRERQTGKQNLEHEAPKSGAVDNEVKPKNKMDFSKDIPSKKEADANNGKAARYRLRRYGSTEEDVDDIFVVQRVIDKSNKENQVREFNSKEFDDHKHSMPCFNALNEHKYQPAQEDSNPKIRQSDKKLHGQETPKVREFNKKLLGAEDHGGLIRKTDKKLHGEKICNIEYRNVFAGKEKENLETIKLDEISPSSKKAAAGIGSDDLLSFISSKNSSGSSSASASKDSSTATSTSSAPSYKARKSEGKEFYTDDLTYEKLFESLPQNPRAPKIVKDVKPNTSDVGKSPVNPFESLPESSDKTLHERFNKLESIVSLMEKKLNIDPLKTPKAVAEKDGAKPAVVSNKSQITLPQKSGGRVEKLLSNQENIQILEDLLNDIKRTQKLEKESKFRQVRAYEWSKNKILHPERTFLLPFVLQSRFRGVNPENGLKGYFNSFIGWNKSRSPIAAKTELFPLSPEKEKSKFSIGKLFKRVFATIGVSFVGLILVDIFYPGLLKTDEPFKRYEPPQMGAYRKNEKH